MIQQDDDLQPKNNDEADKLTMEDGSSLQSPNEEADAKKDNYYEVDEKKLVVTNIGDGTSHDDGLAGADDNDEPDEQD